MKIKKYFLDIYEEPCSSKSNHIDSLIIKFINN
jgi:hypothetical protein